MSSVTVTQALSSLALRPKVPESDLDVASPGQPTPKQRGQGPFEDYPYKHLLPEIFPKLGEQRAASLEDFEHSDPGLRALKHANPRSFLSKATSISDLTPALGTDVKGVSLKSLNSDERDQLALEVARRGLMVSISRIRFDREVRLSLV
jgi:sulfonate dioxygenase